MSYRIEVNDTQIFGNNEAPKALMDFLREQGVEIGEENIFKHTFEVGEFDVMKAITAIEQSIKDMDEIRHRSIHPPKSLWDFSNNEAIIKTAEADGDSLGFNITDLALQVYDTGYIFIPVVFIHTLQNCGCIKPTRPYADGKHLHCYVQTDRITIKGS